MQTTTESTERSPFLSRAETETISTSVTGKLPDWLRGDVVRTAPAVFQKKNWQADHWFDGLGLMYGFRVNANGTVTFRQKLLEGAFAKNIDQGNADVAGFGTAPKRSVFQRMLNPTPKGLDNTNVNCLMLGNDLVAMTETNLQFMLDPETLAVRGHVQWKDSLNALMTIAHPQLDTERKLVVNMGSLFGPSPAIVAFEHAPASRERREIGRWKLKELPYAHSFGLTSKHVVIISHPLRVSPLSLLWSSKGFIDNFTWKPETGTQLGRMDRATGTVAVHTCDPMFVFHTVNSFEDGDSTVMDVLAYDDASIVSSLKMSALRTGLNALTPKLVRLRMKHGVERAEVETMGDTRFEFPIIPYMRQSGKAHSTVWGAAISGTSDHFDSKVLRVSSEGKLEGSYSSAGWVFGEPLFASKPGADRADEGVLLTVGTHQSGERSMLQVLDATSLEPLAQATVQLPIPLGFHGSFIREQPTKQ